jgi:hypothetical protein
LGLTNPSAISFVKIAADNTVSTRTPAQVATDIGAELTANKDAASGYAGLDASTRLKTAEFPAFTGDVTTTAGGVATTLATVNANIGTFGSATQSPQITVDGKGRITAAASVTVTPAVSSVTGLGTGVSTALGVNVGTAGAFVVNGGALGTPSSGTATNLTGTASGLTAGNVTTNANLTGPITSVGNATSIASQTGTGTTFAMSASPTFTGTVGLPTGVTVNGNTITFPTTSQTIPGMNQTNTAGSSFVLDASAASVTAGLKIPSAAGAAPTADGFLAFNTTNHTHAWGSNGTTLVGAAAATGTGTATTCTNQYISAISGIAAPTCSTVTASQVTNAAATNAANTFSVSPQTVSASGSGVFKAIDTATNNASFFGITGDTGAFGTNRNPLTGTVTDATKAAAHVVVVGTTSSGYVQIRTTNTNNAAPTARVQVDGVGNVKIAGTAVRGTTEGTNHLDIFDGTAPVGTLANGISLYSTSGELRVQDAAGNATLLSPHDHTTNEWIFYSVNSVTGKVLRIDMERLVRDLDARMGGGYVHESSDANALTTFSSTTGRLNAVTIPSNIGGTQILTPTPGSTVTLSIDSTAKHIVANWTAGETETINVSGTPQDGTILTLIIVNDGVLPRVLTLGAGLGSIGAVTGVTSKRSTVSYVALGGTFYETSRTVGF